MIVPQTRGSGPGSEVLAALRIDMLERSIRVGRICVSLMLIEDMSRDVRIPMNR